MRRRGSGLGPNGQRDRRSGLSGSIPLTAGLPLCLLLAARICCLATPLVLIGLAAPAGLPICLRSAVSLRRRALPTLRGVFSRAGAIAGAARGLLGGGARRNERRHVLAFVGGRGTLVAFVGGVDGGGGCKSGAIAQGRIALRREVSFGTVNGFPRRAFESRRGRRAALTGSMIGVAGWGGGGLVLVLCAAGAAGRRSKQRR